MKVISKSHSSGDVSKALDDTIHDINEELKKVDGLITKLDCEISAGPSGACVVITAVVNGNQPRHKEIVGVNVRGVSRDHSIKKASDRLNQLLGDRNGEIVDIFSKTIVTPLPGRVYTTMVAAVNEEVMEEVGDANIRRQRLKKTLELLNNDPSAINIAKVAEVFGVSRSMIYRDLEILGFQRVSEGAPVLKK
jgi:hypothetical protein